MATQNAVNANQQGIQYLSSVGVYSGIDGSTAGFVLTSNGTGASPSFASASGITWTDVTGTSQAMSPNNGYTANNAGLVTLTLPTTAAYGTELIVVGKGAGKWKIAQNASQLIIVNQGTSTTGTGGSVAAINQFNTITLICTVANTTWTAISLMGTVTVT